MFLLLTDMNFFYNIKKPFFLFNTLKNNSFKEINIREQKSYLNKYKMRKKINMM